MTAHVLGAVAAAVAIAAAVVAATAPPASRPPDPARHPDLGLLEDAGWGRGLAAWEGLRAACLLAGLTLSLAAGLPLAIVPLVAVAPSIWLRIKADGARDRSRRATGALVSATESSLRSGTSLPEALQRAAESVADVPARRPVVAALRSFDLGSSLDSSLLAAAGAARDERARDVLATLALGIGERLPRERLADLLASIADRVAFEDALADEVRARAAGARQQQWLLAGLVPALAIYLAATLPTLASTLSSDLGRFVLLPVAAALEIGGVVLSRRVVRAATL